MATIATRLVDAVGWTITGGVPTFGSAAACVIRSATIWRARYRSVPSSNVMSIAESPGMDCDSIVLSHGMPLSRSCSSGVVMSSSTSSADSPSASVCTWTAGGSNSG